MKNFVLIGASGYIAPRHLQAIKNTGNNLLAAYDPFDSVGILDSYFPDADFFTEFERFDRHLEKLKRNGHKIDYVSICSPNYLHDAHCRFGMRLGADIICEKPIVLNPWNVTALQEIENETEKKINNILQLRLHESVIKLKEKIEKGPKDKIYEIDLSYLTSRGKWYYASWKGDIGKSGGIATNIGVHFFDMLLWIFGSVLENKVHIHTHDRASGHLKLARANVKWFLSINYDVIPEGIKSKGLRIFRSLKIDNEMFDFTKGFNNLHDLSYQHILNGNGYSLDDCLPSIELVHDIRNKTIT